MQDLAPGEELVKRAEILTNLQELQQMARHHEQSIVCIGANNSVASPEEWEIVQKEILRAKSALAHAVTLNLGFLNR